MEKITLNNGTQMPMLGFGVFRMEDGKDSVEVIKEALKVGYRHIDTAAIYGNEESVGIAIKESGIPREELFITTKLWNEVQRSGDIEAAFAESLQKLGTDYVDMYLVHWPVPGKYVDAYLALEKIYKSGRAKAIGVSNFHPHHLDEIKKVWSVVPAVNQVELHPELTQKPLLKRCHEEGIVITSWSPLGAAKNGLLTKPTLVHIAKKYNKTPAQIILRWNIDLGIITIPKSATPSRIAENFDIFDFKLTEEEIQHIDDLNKDARVGSDPDNFSF